MSPSKKIELILKPPLNGTYYSGDDTISGQVKITLSKSLSMKKVCVNLKAFTETVTKVDSEYAMLQNGVLIQGPNSRSYHTLISIENRVFPPNNVWDALDGTSKPFKVNPGEYNYDFKFDKLGGVRPDCIKRHGKDTFTFIKKQDARLPPSFNNLTTEMNKIDNLDLYFYSFGKILYIVQVEIELGKPKSWFKPFDKIMREQTLIEYIPNIDDLKYEKHGILVDRGIIFNNTSTPGLQTPSLSQQLRERNITSILPADSKTMDSPTPNPSYNMSPVQSSKVLNSSNLNSSNSTNSGSVNNVGAALTSFIKVHQSTFKVGLPGNKNQNIMWLEVRTRNDGFENMYRNDTIFRKGSNKYDRIYVIFKTSSMEHIKSLSISPKRIQLNLLETTTFLSEGIANENLSSLRLIGLDITEYKEQLFNIDELKSSSTNDGSGDYKVECQLKLKDHPSLKRLLFNEENYRHRGNLLYSFKTCAITRTFDLQLLVDWDINGTVRQTEVIIDDVQIYCQIRRRRNNNSHENKADYLPRYVEPPNYGDIVEHITVNENIKDFK